MRLCTIYLFSPIIIIQLSICYARDDDITASAVLSTSQKELNYAINEESEVGSFVGNLKLDAERKFLIPYNQLTQFELYDDSKQGYFRVEQDTGKLFVAARIDRESICAQPDSLVPDKLPTYPDDLWTTAADLNDRGQSGMNLCQVHLALHVAQQYWMNVIVTIHDINDHKPYFPLGPSGTSASMYVVNVSESVTAGHELPLIGAKDADTGMNSVQSYSLRGQELDPSLFAIAYKPPFTLNLVILRELDAETKSDYTGELVACDGGLPQPQCGIQPFQIRVTDLNDNKPVFSKSVYEVEVDETLPVNSTIVRLNATDADSGPRGQVHYRFGQPIGQAVLQHFYLDENTGDVISLRALNARENPRFIIPVSAQDGGSVPLVGQSVIQITVRDVNDHDPWIEVRPVQSVGQSTVAEQKEKSTQMVTLSVEENQPIGTNIGLIIAGDEDVGANSAVTCQLKSSQDQFYLEHANSAKGREMYRLGTNQSFDREVLSDGIIYVDILCLDGGSPKRSTERKIPVMVLDVNEYAPVFDSSRRLQNVFMEEGKPIGTLVTHVEAKDADATPNIHYHLSREAQSLFHIDINTGAITTAVVLDRETMPKIRFSVFATDNDHSDGSAVMATTNLTVHLIDINDNAPELTGNRAFHIVENRPGFSDLVGQLTSVDKDIGNNGTVQYRLISVSSGGKPMVNDTFMLNADSGKLFTLRSLDREEHNQYELTVLLEDLGTPEPLNTTETIMVEVLDENDNAPIWGEPIRILTSVDHIDTPKSFQKSSRMLGVAKLKELALLNATTPLYHGQKITKLVATDPDAPHNANLTYHLQASYFTPFSDEYNLNIEEQLSHSMPSSNVPTHFKLSPVTGDLFIGPGLGGAGSTTKAGLAELYFRVCDNGNPPLDASARLFIQLPALSSSSVALDPNSGGLLTYLISTGHLGIALIVVLFVIMCLTSICLVIAFTTIRRKSPTGSSGGFCSRSWCCPGSRHKALRTSMDNGSVQQNSQFRTDDESGITFDGQLSALGRIYHSPKANSLFSDGASLYKWVPDCSYPMGNFGPPPIYNYPLLNGTIERMHSSHTGSDRSGVALLPCEFPCSSGASCEERGLMEDGRYDTQMLSRRPILEMQHCTQTMDCGKRMENIMQNMSQQSQVAVSEVDGGSADSGQGASEEEAMVMDGIKHGLGQVQSTKLLNFPARRSEFAIPTSSATQIHNGPIISDSQVTQAGHNISTNGVCRTPISTFANSVQQTEPKARKSTPSPPCILPPPPTCMECSKPRWQIPLFTNAEYGHHNQLFEEFAQSTNSPGRQSFTLPPAAKLSPNPSYKQCATSQSPALHPSKVATLSSLPGKQWTK